jgi:hypothetical protein
VIQSREVIWGKKSILQISLDSGIGQTLKDFRVYHGAPIQPGGSAMKRASDTQTSPLRRQAADALRQARKLPVGHARNDLRQLAMGLLWLEKRKSVRVFGRHGVCELPATTIVEGTF